MIKIDTFKIDIWIFVISIFFQGFSIIKTSSFGISFLTTIIFYLFIKYRLLTSIKHNKNFVVFNFLLVALLLFTYLVNEQMIDVLKICRLEIVIFTTYFCVKFFNLIRYKGYLLDFYKIVNKITILICLYGVYQYLAYFFRLPLFLNIFNNNPSYNLRNIGLYSYYGGWVENRIYTTFAEPSFYGQFLTILFFIIYIVRKKYKKAISNTFFSILLILINLYLTGARSGQMQFIYIFIGVIGWILISKSNLKILKSIYYYSFLFIPIINLYIMKLANDYLYNDLSSKARTYSGLYYLQQSFTSIKHILFGHGLGAIQSGYKFINNMQFIEAYAHNGYIEILYECGLVLFIIILIYILLIIRKINNKTISFIVLAVVVNSNDFSTGYTIESVIVLLALIVCIGLSYGERQDFSNGEKNELLHCYSKLQ